MEDISKPVATALVSCAVLSTEVVMMRLLSVRFWEPFAHPVVAVSLVGFAIGGVLAAICRRRGWAEWEFLLPLASALLAVALVPIVPAIRQIAPDLPSLAWRPGEALKLLSLLAVLALPFIPAGLFLGIVLTEDRETVGGLYAANLIGSAAGPLCAILFLSLSRTTVAPALNCGLAGAATVILVGFEHMDEAPLISALVLVAFAVKLGDGPLPVSPYKMRATLESTSGSKRVAHRDGPSGIVEVFQGPGIHHAPGLSLSSQHKVPDHLLILVDGEPAGAVYDMQTPENGAFLDDMTSALPYHVRPKPESVLVVGLGGGGDVHAALQAGALSVTAPELNPDVSGILTESPVPFWDNVARNKQVEVVGRDARSLLQSRRNDVYDVIQLPPTDAFGASGAGMYAGGESFLYTVEAFALMLQRLSPDGVLAVTRWARTPPREGLKVLDTAALALKRTGCSPPDHLVMIRNWATVTVLASRAPLDEPARMRIREFCATRQFDLCLLPGLEETETNRYHILPEPSHYRGAQALLGPERTRFLRRYPFRVEAATDDRPFFYRFMRIGTLRALLPGHPDPTAKSFVEVGFVLQIVSALICTGFGVALLLMPGPVPADPTPMHHGLRIGGSPRLFFASIGAGFMLLEMAFFRRWVCYLGTPVYAAAAVIAAFLLCAGIGSAVSLVLPNNPRTIRWAAFGVIGAAAVLAFALPGWHRLTASLPLGTRFALTFATVAPQAVPMGMLFPCAMRILLGVSPERAPTGWAVNAAASVAATAAAPLIAMAIGLNGQVAMACALYGIAAMAAPEPTRETPPRSRPST